MRKEYTRGEPGDGLQGKHHAAHSLPEDASRTLKRMLANGPLAAMPKRPSDQELLAILAAAQFDPEKKYREGEVNETLEAWIETFCEPYAIDHVTLRRLLVDSRLLSRTTSGSTYVVHRERIAEMEAVANLQPGTVLAEARSDRESRKRKHGI